MSSEININKIDQFINYNKPITESYEIGQDLTISLKSQIPRRLRDRKQPISQTDILKIALNYLAAFSEKLNRERQLTVEIQAKIKKAEEKILELIKGKTASISTEQRVIKSITAPSQIKIIEKINAIGKGIAERNLVILPHQIKNSLKNKIPGDLTPEQLSEISLRICREINELTAKPENRGTSVRFLADESLQNFHKGHILTDNVLDKNGTKIANTGDRLTPSLYKKLLDANIDLAKLAKREIEGKDKFVLDFEFAIQISPDGKNVKISIIPKENAFLGSGAYKSVFKQESFLIPLKLERAPGSLHSRVRKLTYHPEVLQKVFTFDGEQVRAGLASMAKIIDAIKILFHQSNYPSGITSIPKEVIEPADTNRFLFEQERYQNDIEKISEKGEILDLDGKKLRNFELRDRFNVILSAANALEKVHQAGFVHRDIKPRNIVSKINEANELVGYIADFDTAGKIRKDEEKQGTTDFMDLCAHNKLVVPFSDLFALALSLDEILKTSSPNDLLFDSLQKLKDDPATQEGRLKNEIKDKTAAEIENMDAAASSHPEMLKELQKEIQALHKAEKLIDEILEYNSKIYEFIIADNQFMQAFNTNDERGINAGLQRLYQRYPHATDSYFIEELRKIQASLPK